MEVGGAGDQIGFVRFEEAQNRGEQRRIADTRAQLGRIEPGQVEQPRGALRLAERPHQGLERQRLRICFRPRHGLGSHCDHWGLGVAKRVLVVEDNELNLKLFCDLLRAHAFEVEPVKDGREAVARARAFAPDLVVMDIQMPHVTGDEIIRQMRLDPELRALPIMAVTAYAGHEDEARIRAAGANAYVSKPISLVRFMEEVRALAPSETQEAPQP